MPATAINPERLVLDSEKYLDEAQTAYTRRDLDHAEEYLFLAADRIEKLLLLTPAELVSARVNAIKEIGDFIEQIQAEKTGDSNQVGLEPKHKVSGKPTERPLFTVEEKPAIKLADVAGMSSLKELIRTKLIYPLRDPEMTKKYGVKRGAGILLYGQPGTGKSMIARAIAGEFDAAFIAIKASDVLDCLYGQTEKNIATLFAQAKNYASTVIFLDELDGLGADRDASDSHMRRFINQLLIELQGFSGGLDNIIVLGATNKPWLLDKALIRAGRLDEMFYVPLPDEETRREIWRLNLHKKIVDATVDIEALTATSEGLSGADIAGICTKTNTEAYRKAVESSFDVPITQADLMRYFPREPARLHQADLEQLQSFARLHDRNAADSIAGMPNGKASILTATTDPLKLPENSSNSPIFLLNPASPAQAKAMQLLAEYRGDLGDSWRGFEDEVQNNPELDLDEFRVRIQAFAEETQRQRDLLDFEQLLRERRPFLDAVFISQMEEAAKNGSVNFKNLSARIEEKSHEHFVGHLLDITLQQLGLNAKRGRKLRRKAFRKITRQRMRVTQDSVTNLVRWLDQQLSAQLAEHERRSRRSSSAAALVTDINELIIPPGLVDFSDVAGMSQLKDQLEDAMDLCLDPRKRELYLRKTGHDPLTLAVLLYGAPGTGKTFMARAAAGELAQKYDFTVMHVPHDAIRSLHYTKKLTRIREIFELAKKNAPTLVVWDEFDELATPPRFSGRKYDADICATLKQEFEGAIESHKIVLHLATSNHPWQVDPALLRDGRIGAHVHVLPPDAEARKEFWMLLIDNAEAAKGLDHDQLTQLTEGMTIAEIREVYKAVSAEVIREVMSGNLGRKFQTNDFVKQIDKQPSRHFRTWLAEVKAAFCGRYACQRELFPELVGSAGTEK